MAELIRIFKDAKNDYEVLKDIVHHLFESDKKVVDKKHCEFSVSSSQQLIDDRSPMRFMASCYWGYYGHSSVSNKVFPNLENLLAASINTNIELIYRTALGIAHMKMIEAQSNARLEAEEVLEKLK